MMIFKHIHKDLQGQIISEITYEVHQESGLDEVMQEFRQFLLAVSYHPDTVSKYIEAN